jgi:DNA-binding MarR family transcriptional regulator
MRGLLYIVRTKKFTGVKVLESQFDNLDLMDTLSERHLQLRRVTESMWNNKSNIYLSNSEWFIIARIYQKENPVSYVTKKVDISRQATHKLIKSLESKGLVETFNVSHNKKDKYLRLTKLGEECYKENKALKARIEKQIAEKIGSDRLNILKEILKTDWGI